MGNMEDIKAIYSLIVKCLKAGDMQPTIDRLQGALVKEIRKVRYYV